jgi:uncharacterized membrane protein YkoI
MKSKIVLIASGLVTAVVLLVGFGVANAMNDGNNSPTTTASLPVDTMQQVAEREAAYNQLIVEANQRIEILNNQVTELQKNPNQVPVNSGISVEKAAQIALDSTDGSETLVKIPEMVDYQGTPSYEVTFQNGVVYVNSQTGEVLFSSVKPRITAGQAGMIAGEALGGMNPNYADIKLVNLNGVEIYRVTFSGDKEYIVFIDMNGTVIKAQVLEYTGGGGGGGSIPAGASSSYEDEHEDDD